MLVTRGLGRGSASEGLFNTYGLGASTVSTVPPAIISGAGGGVDKRKRKRREEIHPREYDWRIAADTEGLERILSAIPAGTDSASSVDAKTDIKTIEAITANGSPITIIAGNKQTVLDDEEMALLMILVSL
jgi:hypothetical protein